jgi:hypothetical protein
MMGEESLPCKHLGSFSVQYQAIKVEHNGQKLGTHSSELTAWDRRPTLSPETLLQPPRVVQCSQTTDTGEWEQEAVQDIQFRFREQEREEAQISPEEAELMMNLHARRRYSTLSEMASILHVSEEEAAELLHSVRGVRGRRARPRLRFGSGAGAAAVALVIAVVVWAGFFSFLRMLRHTGTPRLVPAMYDAPGTAATARSAPEPMFPQASVDDGPVIVQVR